jgi:hypothetical protein
MECAGYATASNEIFSCNNYPVIIEKENGNKRNSREANACQMS